MYETNLREQVSQGDIFRDVPVLYAMTNGGDLQADLRHVTAILISHDCEYDKPATKFVYVAEIVSLSTIAPENQGNVRRGRVAAAYHTEACSDQPEGYADLRRISRVDKSWFENRANDTVRVVSLTEEARLALQRQIAVFFGFGRSAVPPP